MEWLAERLGELSEEKLKAFNLKLIPGLPADAVLGVRTPRLRRLASEMEKEGRSGAFLSELPHAYLEENLIHAFLLCGIRDYSLCLERLEAFLPFVDNWAVCDALSPGCFRDGDPDLHDRIPGWLESDRPYTVRFGIGTAMRRFTGPHYAADLAERIADLAFEHYYVEMGQAWYFATLLATNEKAALEYLQNARLSPVVHRMTVRKAFESFRVSDGCKEKLKAYTGGKTH